MSDRIHRRRPLFISALSGAPSMAATQTGGKPVICSRLA